MSAPPVIFDRQRYAARRGRAAAGFDAFDFLHRRAMEDIVDRLEAVNRNFPRALFIGAGGLTDLLTEKSGVGDIFTLDLSASRLAPATLSVVGDEERLPIAHASFNVVVSLLTLHAANDLIGALTQARLALKPDGLFIAAIFAEDTLSKLRSALYAAEADIRGGVSARIAPFGRLQDFGHALARAGFALPVADIDKVTVQYPEPANLLRDLRGMGETNALAEQGQLLTRAILANALARFAAGGGSEQFEIVYLTGWAPHESQQKPLKPGSAKMSLRDAIDGAI